MERDSLPELRQLAERTPAWFADALCRNTSPDLFFPEDYESPHRAIQLCRVCPSRLPCLRFALDTNQRGVWGGTTEKNRTAIRSGRLPVDWSPPAPVVHGTNAGYMAHYRRGEQPCEACRRAHSVAKAHNRHKATG